MNNKTQKFWNRMANRYSKSPVPDQSIYERKLQITQQFLTKDSNVFEFGCGTGSTALIHAPLVKSITAIDVSDQMIKIAKNKAQQQNINNITFKTCGIDEFDCKLSSFDVVLGLSILHLLKNTEEITSKIYNLLKPGGYFITSTPCLGDSSMALFKWLGPIGEKLGLLPTLHVFKQNDLTHYMTQAGFTLVEHWQPSKGKATFMVCQKQA